MKEEFNSTQQAAIRDMVLEISNQEINGNLKYQIEKIFFAKLAIVGAIVAAIGIGALLYFPRIIAENIADTKIKETFGDQISSMKNEVTEIKQLRTSIMENGVPSGSVVAFIGAQCPNGWSEYAEARGAAIVGAITEEQLGTTNLTEFRIAQSDTLAIIDGDSIDTDGDLTTINLYALYYCSKN